MLALVGAGALLPTLAHVPPAAAESSRSGSVLTVGADLSGTACGPIHFDPVQFTVATCYMAYDWPIYGGLLRLTPSGATVPDLAESVTVPDPQTIDVQLRAGVVFSDGTPFTADAVKAGLERTIHTEHPAGFNAQLFDISGIDATGPRSLTLHFSQPVANTFYAQLADEESFIVSPTAVADNVDLDTHPVGAGPFLLKSFVPGQRIVLVKNPRYWDAKAIKLQEVDFVNVPAGPQQVNALESGLVQVVSGLPVSDLPAVRHNPSLHVQATSQDGNFLWLPICKSSGPLADVRVRQALNYATDRSAINKALLYGVGEPVWGLYPKGSRLFDRSLANIYAYNTSKAKQLLAAAGYARGFTTSIMPLPTPLDNQLAQVLQAEWKKIGVNVQIMATTNYVNDFYVRHLASMGLISSTRPGIQKVSGPYLPGSIGNACSYSNPTLTQLVNQLGLLSPSSARYKPLWDQVQSFVIRNALSVYVDFVPAVTAFSKRVTNLHTLPYLGGGLLDYRGVTLRG